VLSHAYSVRSLECSSDVSLDNLTDYDVITLGCHVTYTDSGHPVSTRFNCMSTPASPDHNVSSSHNSSVTLVTASDSQRVQVGGRLNTTLLHCRVQFISNDTVFGVRSWTSPTVTVTPSIGSLRFVPHDTPCKRFNNSVWQCLSSVAPSIDVKKRFLCFL